MATQKEPLSITHPELAAQAHGWDPSTLTAGSQKVVAWKCDYNHIWKCSTGSRKQGGGCPVCSNQSVLPGFNDIATTHPELAAQADGWDPSTLTAGSGKVVAWKCIYGHPSKARVHYRSQGNGCPVCSGRVVLAGFNDLATMNPELAAQAHGWDPSTLSPGSKRIVGWKCDYNHIWTATINSRSQGNGCAVCSGRAVLAGFNDLATTHPELAAQADGWDPSTLSSGSNKSVSWRCELGHSWAAAVNDRSSGNGCAVCSGRAVLAGFNDLATTNPELAAQADGWDPSTLSSGSGAKVGWKCDLGHSWAATLKSRSNGNNCPVCSGRAVLAGFNDLATTHPELAAQADGWGPTTLTFGSHTKVKDRSKGAGCPSCAQSGFDPNKDGWLYFIDHDALSLFQIGISNFPESRLGQHSKRGWEVMEVRGPMEGHIARQLETAILHAVERRGAILGHKAEIEKFDGYSEAWTKDSLTVSSFKQLLDWVYEDDH